MRLVLATALAALVAAPAMAQQRGQQPEGTDLIDHVRTVSDLARVCDPPWRGVPRLEAIAYCQGFLTGAGQYHTLLHPTGARNRPLYCMPSPGPTVAEGGLAFAAWSRANPSYGNEPALDGVLRWAQASYPCSAPVARTPGRGGRS
jgi:Rap1a immunity proteins